MCAMNLNGVKTCLPETDGGIDNELLLLLDFVMRKTVGRESLGGRGGKILDFECRGAYGSASALYGSKRSAMMKLPNRATIILMQAFVEFGESRYESVVIGVKVYSSAYRRLPAHARDIDCSDSALGHALVEIDAGASICRAV